MKKIKKYEKFILENMSVKPDNYYSKFNLEVDGIRPASEEASGVDSLLKKKRRVAWLERGLSEKDSEFRQRMNQLGLGVIKLYNMDSKIAKDKIEDLSINGWGNYAFKQVDREYIVYLPEYEEQAKLAQKELLRRGGWWHETEPIADIYLARLMGYGEEYIVPYIRKYFPNFDVETYIKENPRNKTIK